jgi:hypothetical protein
MPKQTSFDRITGLLTLLVDIVPFVAIAHAGSATVAKTDVAAIPLAVMRLQWAFVNVSGKMLSYR